MITSKILENWITSNLDNEKFKLYRSFEFDENSKTVGCTLYFENKNYNLNTKNSTNDALIGIKFGIKKPVSIKNELLIYVFKESKFILENNHDYFFIEEEIFNDNKAPSYKDYEKFINADFPINFRNFAEFTISLKNNFISIYHKNKAFSLDDTISKIINLHNDKKAIKKISIKKNILKTIYSLIYILRFINYKNLKVIKNDVIERYHKIRESKNSIIIPEEPSTSKEVEENIGKFFNIKIPKSVIAISIITYITIDLVIRFDLNKNIISQIFLDYFKENTTSNNNIKHLIVGGTIILVFDIIYYIFKHLGNYLIRKSEEHSYKYYNKILTLEYKIWNLN